MQMPTLATRTRTLVRGDGSDVVCVPACGSPE